MQFQNTERCSRTWSVNFYWSATSDSLWFSSGEEMKQAIIKPEWGLKSSKTTKRSIHKTNAKCHLSRLSLWASILQSLPLVCGASRLPHNFCLMDKGIRKALGPTKVVMLLAGSIRDVSIQWTSWKDRKKLVSCYFKGSLSLFVCVIPASLKVNVWYGHRYSSTDFEVSYASFLVISSFLVSSLQE